jgi:hypothetical protein
MLTTFHLAGRPSRGVAWACGAMAQLVARLHGMQKVRGSNPLSSTRSEACWYPIMIIWEQAGEQATDYP